MSAKADSTAALLTDDWSGLVVRSLITDCYVKRGGLGTVIRMHVHHPELALVRWDYEVTEGPYNPERIAWGNSAFWAALNELEIVDF